MQLLREQPFAPPPELPVKVQFVSVLETAPVPEFPINAQLLSTQPLAPFSEPTRMQLFSVPPEAPPTPLVRVNPDRGTPANDAHRLEWAPSMIVNRAPLTLRMDSAPE